MPILRLVRHAEPAAAWGADPDPGLSSLGASQAEACAQALAPMGGLILSSPLRRCRETAAPLAGLLGIEAIRIEPAVAEIVAPVGIDDRQAWLRDLFARGVWTDPGLGAWRDRVVEALMSLDADATVFTHYLAINAAVSAATGKPRIAVCDPAHVSVTVLESADGRLRLRELGAQGGRTVV